MHILTPFPSQVTTLSCMLQPQIVNGSGQRYGPVSSHFNSQITIVTSTFQRSIDYQKYVIFTMIYEQYLINVTMYFDYVWLQHANLGDRNPGEVGPGYVSDACTPVIMNIDTIYYNLIKI